MATIFLKALVLWAGILVLAVFNGGLRENVLTPLIGRVAGQLVSGVVLSVCIVVVAWAVVPWFGPLPESLYLYIGVFWLGLTVAFEFSFGRLMRHQSWRGLFDAYLFKEGNIWPVVLGCTAAAPWVSAKLRGLF